MLRVTAQGLGAVLTAIVTPFDADLTVDEEAFVALLHHLSDHGSDGFVELLD
jgi:4-hydroxy-tetrahydrodipicolinate synthase